MRKLIPLLALLFSFGVLTAQEKLSKEEKARRKQNIEAGNPFKQYHYKAKIATLSKGKYLEFHDLDSIVTIGTVRWNVKRKLIVGRILRDSLNSDAQPIGDTPGRWISPDPLSDEFPGWSPYTFTNNNPVRFTDPTGMAPDDVIITGSQSQAAFQQLQKSVAGQLNLSMDSAGKVTYTASGTVGKDAQQLVNAIDDHSITVNVSAESTKMTSTGQLYVGGAFMGNTVTTSASGTTVSANQEINPGVLGAMSTYYGKPGGDTLHEVTEAYQGATMSQKVGVSSGPDGTAGSVYKAAHKAATPQSGKVQETIYDASGSKLSMLPGGVYPPSTVKADYSVKKNGTPAQIIQTYP